MPWARLGDDAATYPALMQLHGMQGADERTVNEAFGFLLRISTLSAGHKTDYVVDAGTAHMIGGARTEALLKLLVKAGLLTAQRQGGLRSWTILADPEFLHIRTRAELEAEARYRNELRDDALLVGLRRRDGDNCRWCGIYVQWLGRKGQQHAEPDHLEGSDVPGTVENMVIACRRCNRARGADQTAWESTHKLLPVPTNPQYGEATAAHLTKNGYPTEPTIRSDQAPAHTAAADPAPTRVRPAAPHSDPAALAAARTPLPSESDPTRPETWGPPKNTPRNTPGNDIPRSDGTASAGSGRDGSGTSSGTSPGLAGDVPAPPPTSPPVPRRRRGRRGAGSSRTQGEPR